MPKKVEIINLSSGYEVSSPALILRERKLSVSGAEGIKRLVMLKLLGRTSDKRVTLFSKEYPESEKNEMISIIRGYQQLKSMGIPVPDTVRHYYDKRRKKYYLLLSDLSEGGRKEVLGYSDNLSPKEIRNLKRIGLKTRDINTIYESLIAVARTAGEHQVLLKENNYFILRDKRKRTTEVVVLDIAPYSFMYYDTTQENEENAGRFISLLKNPDLYGKT